MKIEVGENLIASYLRHVEGCRIIQTNWRTSSQWKITEYDQKRPRELFEKVKGSPFFNGIFKNNGFNQLIKQAEIDVIGINSSEKSIFGIDVAFHNAGLNYKETIPTVFKKLFRTILVLQTYFNDYNKFNAYFVTPKAITSVEYEIRTLIEEANKLIGDEMILVDFICNESFFSSIIDSTLNNINDDNDTSELFLRSIKLIQLDTRIKSSNDQIKQIKKSIVNTDKTTIDGMKILQFVQYNMRKLFATNLVSENQISNPQNKEYSKKTFDQNYEILRSADKEITGSDGRNRYYTNDKYFGDYYLNSQWVERHWKPFKKWLENHKFQDL